MALRIVSLLPSATEIVCALGLRDQLVGVSHECDYPAGVESLPHVTAPKIDPSRPSREIDDEIRHLVREGLSVYRIDEKILADCAPDLIVTQDQCDVCAVSLPQVVEATKIIAGSNTRIVSLRPNRLADVWQDIQTVADAADVSETGHAVVTDIRDRLADLERATRRLSRPRIACVEWLGPLMAAGNWVPELVELGGGATDLGTAGQHSPWIELDDVLETAPEVICAMPCGFDLARTRDELEAILKDPRWRDTPAAREGRVWAVDGNAYFNRPGPRLVESAEILAAMLHPDECGDRMPPGAAARIEMG